MVKETELERKIIDSAKEHFLAEGIMNTDMKQLASELGISRSTLYRHFPSSLHIAFHIVEDCLIYLTSDDESLFEDICGYEALSLYMHRFVSRLCVNLNMVRFLHEFDTIYGSKPADATPPEGYIEYLSSNQHFSTKLFRRGVADGSIKFRKDIKIGSGAFLQTALALAERIMLREEAYLKEHGVAREFIDYTIDMMLASIRA